MLITKFCKGFVFSLVLILIISMAQALGEECCGDSFGGGSTPLCTGNEVCMRSGAHYWVNSTTCASEGNGTCEALECNFCNVSDGCTPHDITWNDGTYNFYGWMNVYDSDNSHGSSVPGTPTTNPSHTAVCIAVLYIDSGAELKSLKISNLQSYTDAVQGIKSTTGSTDPIAFDNTSSYLYWDFCADGHTGSCSSGSGMVGDNYSSWMYYSIPDSYGIDWINTSVVDQESPPESDVGPGGSGITPQGGYNGGEVIPEFSTTGIIVAILVILAVTLVVYKRKK